MSIGKVPVCSQTHGPELGKDQGKLLLQQDSHLASQIIKGVGGQVRCGLVDLASSAFGCALNIPSCRLGLAGNVAPNVLG